MAYNPYYPYGYPSYNPLTTLNPYMMQFPYYPPQQGYSYGYPSPWSGVQSYENPQSAPTPQSIYPFTLQQQQPTYQYYPNMQPYYYPTMTTGYYPYGQQQLLPSY